MASAFTKIMASHAEDKAWQNAASNEQAARGKRSFQRTCPFYKILPNLSEAVDAFRYGKVDGINAYFLSHFHSDHYIGLTSSWAHGPIYCSRVTVHPVMAAEVDHAGVSKYPPSLSTTEHESPGLPGTNRRLHARCSYTLTTTGRPVPFSEVPEGESRGVVFQMSGVLTETAR